MDFIALSVDKDNFMYFYYNSTSAFSVDAYKADVIVKCLDLEFKKNIYNEKELDELNKMDTPRKLMFSLTTHGHFDHNGGDQYLIKQFPSLVIYNSAYLKKNNHDENIPFIENPNLSISYLCTPCHTQDSICFYIKSNQQCLITGDTILYLGVGKFFEGSASQMYSNIKKLRALPLDTLMLYGHDNHIENTEKARKFFEIPDTLPKPFLTLEQEKKYNPFFNYKKLKWNLESVDKIKRLREIYDEENKE
ncbi:putative hydroxyacylglutathione hydrolase [Astathelohania contejeani]|uniref:Hydroxyacylglutathione hydrolase n=1 Tax=Astathelohania contejeani TaxID=164912 RepID=A0ABQ7HWF4_9MICR|nr:putative hydroxyacylglutathione hydrolase [Thelohania contejeani]